MTDKIYLGDSVYAEWIDDHHGLNIKLTTNNGYADDPRNVIFLDTLVFDSLLKFVEAKREGR